MYVLKKYTFVTHITKIIDNYYYENKLVSIFIMMNIGLKIWFYFLKLLDSFFLKFLISRSLKITVFP